MHEVNDVNNRIPGRRNSVSVKVVRRLPNLLVNKLKSSKCRHLCVCFVLELYITANSVGKESDGLKCRFPVRDSVGSRFNP
ncbi:hypothetical protein BV898_19846 [Hypsibius exemplaris]|uniref:Uncharacterized protein n=1 Tax=Hypsibius exemplaris TaxID=2072580 RepID=A0A9X6RPB8_HYPEX|nr:hypothetical protein BV898_19846 [Hypsibius exemplaris]